MYSQYRLITLAFSSLFLISTGFAQPVKIEGEVKGANNKPAKADLRIDRVDKKAAPVMVKTNAKGRFAATVLDVGTYKLTAILPGGIQSAQVIKADGKKQLFVTFDMKPASAKTVAVVKKTKSIWVPSSTGSHMLGHWEDVDDNSTPGVRKSGQNVDTMSGRDLERTMSSTNVAPAQPGGR